MRKSGDVKLIFDSTLFWDAEAIDAKRHADYIIARVLDFGDEKDVKRLKERSFDDNIINHTPFNLFQGSSIMITIKIMSKKTTLMADVQTSLFRFILRHKKWTFDAVKWSGKRSLST